MSYPCLAESDTVLTIYEAQAIIIEKNEEIKRLKQEIESLRMAISKENQQELAQKVAKLEEEISAAKNNNCDLIDRLTSLELHANQMAEQLNNLILILGGWLALNSIYLLDSKTQRWKKLKITLPIVMQDFGAVEVNEEIYIFGGYTKDCYKLKDDGSWMKLASLNQSRFNISNSSLVYKGGIWAIGGASEESLKSVEKYNISQNKWTYMPEINCPRSGAAAAVYKDRIFVTGGWNGKDLKSVEMFDPKLQKWILFCDLPFGLFDHTMLISNSILSIFGGWNGYNQLNSVWEMDIEDPAKKWTEKQSFKRPRSTFGIGNLSSINEIIVFGGYGDATSEIFDRNKWIDGPALPQKLSRFAYISIPRPVEESFLEKFS